MGRCLHILAIRTAKSSAPSLASGRKLCSASFRAHLVDQKREWGQTSTAPFPLEVVSRALLASAGLVCGLCSMQAPVCRIPLPQQLVDRLHMQSTLIDTVDQARGY